MSKSSYVLLVALIGISGFALGCTKSRDDGAAAVNAPVAATLTLVEPDTKNAKKKKGYELPEAPNAPKKGAANAKVTIHEFSDFQCPSCASVNRWLAQVMKAYGDQVQIVWHNYPLPSHANARLAAEAALEVHEQKGDEGFWTYHDLLFAAQNALSRPELEKYATGLGGIDMTAFRAALDSGKHGAAIDADMAALASTRVQIGVPTFFINQRLLQGTDSFLNFKVLIEAGLNE